MAATYAAALAAATAALVSLVDGRRAEELELVRVHVAPVLEPAVHAEAGDGRARRTRGGARLAEAVKGQAQRLLSPHLAAPQLEVVVVEVAAFIATAHDLDTGGARAADAHARLNLLAVDLALGEAQAEPLLPEMATPWPKVVEVAIAFFETSVPHLQSAHFRARRAAHLLALAMSAALLPAPHDPCKHPHDEACDARVLLAVVLEPESKATGPRTILRCEPGAERRAREQQQEGRCRPRDHVAKTSGAKLFLMMGVF